MRKVETTFHTRCFTIASVILLASAIAGWCQDYYEASGQTAVFTLTAGAKAQPSALKSVNKVKPEAAFRVTCTGNRLIISGGFTGEAKLYRLNGRLVGVCQINHTGKSVLNFSLPSDVYLVRFEGNGGEIKIARLTVLPEGGR